MYDFRYLKSWELQQFNNRYVWACFTATSYIERHRTDLHAIHYTAFTTEGRKYVPWMVRQLKGYGVRFVKQHIQSVNEVGKECMHSFSSLLWLLPDYDIVVNAAGKPNLYDR